VGPAQFGLGPRAAVRVVRNFQNFVSMYKGPTVARRPAGAQIKIIWAPAGAQIKKKLGRACTQDKHRRASSTHTSHHRPALVDLSRFSRVSTILTHSRSRRFCTCALGVLGVTLVGVYILSAAVAVAVVRPDVISQRVFISRGRTKTHWKALQAALVQAHTIMQ
jgi:hypothetical protein